MLLAEAPLSDGTTFSTSTIDVGDRSDKDDTEVVEEDEELCVCKVICSSLRDGLEKFRKNSFIIYVRHPLQFSGNANREIFGLRTNVDKIDEVGCE